MTSDFGESPGSIGERPASNPKGGEKGC